MNESMTAFPTHSDAWTMERLREPAQGSRTRIVIDTDAANEVDDQFALAWALLSPAELQVDAVHAAPFSFSHRRASLPKAPPDARPFDPPQVGMERSYEEIERVFERMSLPSSSRVYRGSAGYLESPSEPRRSAACDHLIALARTADAQHPLYVVALGCVTNIASALLLAPDIVDRIVVVWTSGYPSSAPHVNASFNLEQDAAASRVLLDSGVPLVYLPGFHVGAQLRLSSVEVEHYVKGQGVIGDYLHGLFSNNPLWSILGHDASKPYSWVIWDLICLAWLIRPEWVPSTLVRTPRLDAALRWVQAAQRPLMREGHAVQRDAIFNDFFAKLAR
ncbi:nucleoside hydrolase [Ramlibacter sp.]|uniref:nucleoside hydrolase n=1 Tax=Ramlibacter sp. TaxID=1917967 RepID=UPI001821FDB9|nr:nucleoside hydrolase [Ramlibacter sp.]MBA2675951.1 nucleoside hydrolase [Ramlibacter sp.]